MLKYLTAKEKSLSRDLWEEAFPEDSKSFDDYYYQEKTRDNRILAAVEDGQIQAMVQMNPYLLQAGGRRWRVDYLVGVATRKEKRHQGYMRRLLERMMADLREEQMPFCYLMPAAEAIYRPFGFTYIFRQPEWELVNEDGLTRRPLLGMDESRGAAENHWADEGRGAVKDSRVDENRHAGMNSGAVRYESSAAAWRDTAGKRRYLEWLADWMNRWLERRYQVFAVRDDRYLLRLMEEIASENGTFDVLYDQDAMIGVQATWGWTDKEQRLLYCEAPYVREAAEPKPAIMARIITPEQFVKAIHLKHQAKEDELTLRLYLKDPLLPENQGLWLWHLERESSWLERAGSDRECASSDQETECADSAWECTGSEQEKSGAERSEADLRLTITELTSWLFGYNVPEAAKPFEDKIETLKHVFLDEVV